MTNDRRKTDNWEVMQEKLDKLEKTLENVQDEIKKLSDYLHSQSSDVKLANQRIDNHERRLEQVEKEIKDNSSYISKSKGFWASVGGIAGLIIGSVVPILITIFK